MKFGSDVNYNVRVRKRRWEEPVEKQTLYAGMYTFALNQVVRVSFVPRLLQPGRPRPTPVCPMTSTTSPLPSRQDCSKS